MKKFIRYIVIVFAILGVTNISKAQSPSPSSTPAAAATAAAPAGEEQQDPILHPTLTPKQTERLKKLQKALAEVDDSSLEKWIDDFKRDENPDRELALFEAIAQAYQSFASSKSPTIEKKRDAYGLLLERSESSDDDALKNYEITALTQDEAKEVLRTYQKAAAALEKE